VVHPTINIEELDPQCNVRGLVINQPRRVPKVETIMNMSFGMLGINSAVVVKKWMGDRA
jgi:3-oxoacyl-[acyl-carrier-protein] synthase II